MSQLARPKTTSSAISELTTREEARSVSPSSSSASLPRQIRPFTSQFTDADAEASAARGTYLKILIGGSFFVIVAIFAYFSIYWGALWRTPARNLPGWIVDFDGGQVGEAVLQGINSIPPGLSKITWEVKNPSDFPNGAADFSNEVVEERSWVAIAVLSGATQRLNAAIASANASYDGSSAIAVYGVEARSENAYRAIIRPSVEGTLQIISKTFASQFAKQLASSSPANVTNILINAPQIITQPISYTIFNLRPFDIPVASAVSFVGLIYLLIISFFVVVSNQNLLRHPQYSVYIQMIGNGAREAAGLERILSTGSLIKLRLATVFIVYFFLSFFYSLLSLAFQVPFDRKFGPGGFVLFWMLNWSGMLSVGLALESLMTILTVRFMPFFMILWIISNVSVCFMPIEVLPGIFRYGYAAPFYNISRAMRTILFSTKNQVGLNFGVLIVWIVISCITLPAFQWFVRRNQVRQVEKAEEVNEKTS
ncbi:hypothetical protein HGRIS_000778 [Hohenbuehelia grisea]|uniref:DUF3533 domain-containing protein n=1 Tax=Hohenbuehelia grisea TaxID=104357 RepID=A0ABR3IPT2_9AGAR